ncbi:MAG: ketoacyl-ACP synthase III [Gemmatimonadota bacterium]|nr:MAG: ketoacyl-ACP synthase III [Gemmatimonadota bacterium]
MRLSRIAGTGHFVPARVVTNHDLAAVMDTSDEWILERTGIRERRFTEDGVTGTDLAVEASRQALSEAGWEAGDVQFIIFATLSPDMYFPGNGVLLQRELGLPGVGAMDVRNQCTGFVYSLSAADAYIRMGMYDRILVVGAERHSAGLRMDDRGRDTAVLFGDGAGAVCVDVTTDPEGSRLISHHLHADGRFAEELCIKSPGAGRKPWLSADMVDDGSSHPFMNGREVFRNAVTRFPEVIMEALDGQGLTPDQVDVVIPHQANQRITDAVTKRLGLPREKVLSNIERFGNTTAASIPIVLSEAVKADTVQRGDLVCLAAFGSGFTWAATLMRY